MIDVSEAKAGRMMAQAASYDEWKEAAIAHDRASGQERWRQQDESKDFGFVSIRRRLERLSDLIQRGESRDILFELNEGIHGNMDGMGNPRLYRMARFGTKALIEDYVDVIVAAIEYIASAPAKEIPQAEKLDFFRRAQHCYGRSAFMMSGSGTFLYFHIGVVKALWSEGLLPRILSGSSGGAMVGAAISTRRDDQIAEFFEPNYLMYNRQDDPIGRSLLGVLPEMVKPEEAWNNICREIPDLTFQEAFALTGKHFNISIAPAERHQTSRMLNAISSPNVYIREAVLASCAVPGLFPAVTLAAKDHLGRRQAYLPNRKWVDGSMTHDLPEKRLARLYGANHFIVSQANPLVSALVDEHPGNDSPFSILRHATHATMKAWINAGAALLQRPLSYFPPVNSAANLALSIMNQNFTGDINIVRPQKLWHPAKLMSRLSPFEIAELIRSGERTTWPKIEMIRTQTRVGRVLERILDLHEADAAAGCDPQVYLEPA